MNPAPLNDCGCCEGVEPETPVPIENRAGLSAIAYRCGTHAQFKASLLSALSTSAHPALQGLNTRSDDDFTVALLDAWAMTADVLSFYQERIAQESFLRTATERQSLLQLGRLLGYELRAGVAASTYLAFTIENAPGLPRVLTVDARAKVQSIPGPGEAPQLFETVETIEARAEWNEIPARQTQPQSIEATTRELFFQGIATNLRKGDALLLLGPDAPSRIWDLCRVDTVDADFEQKRTRVSLADGPAHFTAPTAGVAVFVFRQRASIFGHNAPDRRVLPDETLAKFDTKTAISAISRPPSGIFGGVVNTLFASPPDWTFTVSDGSGGDIDLDTTYSTFVVGNWVVLRSQDFRLLGRVTAVTEAGRTDYTLTGKVTRLTVSVVASDDSKSLTDFDRRVRSTQVYGETQELPLSEAPIAAPVSDTQLVLAGEFDEFAAGRVIAVTGKRVGGDLFSGVVTLTGVTPAGNITTLTHTPALPALERGSVRINANVALATHGETVAEILGSADASVPFQQFALKQPPLTYVRAANPIGARSTLEIRVNDLLWHEVPSFFGRGAHERIYVTRTGDDGVTVVMFGDGVTGARPSSGQDNVRAIFRRGSGLEGQVKTGQLTTLLSRPLGLKAAINPVDATGAAQREQLADARQNAPVTVLTLDRIVSLQDYEDFVRGFAGIAKALATWTWDGRRRGVFITVAGAAGAEIELNSDFGKGLFAAVQQASVPGVPVRIQSYRRASGLFTVSAAVKVDPDHESPRVLAAVRTALEAAFSFQARTFGQSVHLSEVIAVMQNTPGVLAVDVNALRRVELPADVSLALPGLSRFRMQALVRRFTVAAVANVTLAVSRFGDRTLVSGSKVLRPSLPLAPVHPPDRLVAAVPQAGTRDATIAPAELLLLTPLAPEQIGVMP